MQSDIFVLYLMVKLCVKDKKTDDIFEISFILNHFCFPGSEEISYSKTWL